MKTNVPFLDLKAQYQSIKEEVNDAILSVVESCAYAKGPAVRQFQKNFAQYCETKYAVGVANGTDAIYLALRAVGVGPGDEVITTPDTFIATTEAITQAGAKIVFVDIDPKTYNIDVSKIEEKITPKTKAIIPVHLFGQPADMEPILEIAKKHNLKVVEDAAQAHGARLNGRRVGTFGDIACFSFYPGKNLGAYGDGGAVVTNNEEIATQVEKIADHGSLKKYIHEEEGVNSRLDSIQAAVLDVKLKYLDQWNESRRKNAYIYNELLKTADGIITPVELENCQPVYHLYVIQVNDRDGLQQKLSAAGIASGIHYPYPLHLTPAYQYLGLKRGDFPEAELCAERFLSLPMYAELTESMIQTVFDAVEKNV